METWEEIAASIELRLVIGEDGRPSEADLDAYEAVAGFKLPLDYRRFAIAYGRGMMGIAPFEFRFDTPRSTAEGRGKLPKKKAPRRDPDSGLSEFTHITDDQGRRRRLVLFGDVCDYGCTFSWDTAEVTDPVKHEMAIYLDGGRGYSGVFRRVGSSFLEVLVNEILRGPFNRDLGGNSHGELEPLRESYAFSHVPDL